jgi:hypothetical protein
LKWLHRIHALTSSTLKWLHRIQCGFNNIVSVEKLAERKTIGPTSLYNANCPFLAITAPSHCLVCSNALSLSFSLCEIEQNYLLLHKIDYFIITCYCVKSFFHSLQHLKTIRHPTIVKFLAYGKISGNHILVTEPVQCLEQVIEGLSPCEMLAGMYNIVEAITFLHDAVSPLTRHFIQQGSKIWFSAQ